MKASVEANKVRQNWLFSKTTTYIPIQNQMENLVKLKIVTQFQKLIDLQPCKVNGMQMSLQYRYKIKASVEANKACQNLLFSKTTTCITTQNLMENLVELKIVTQFQKLIDLRPWKVNGMQILLQCRYNIPKG